VKTCNYLQCNNYLSIGNDTPNEHDINHDVVPHCATKWRELGTALGLRSPQLDIINVDHPNSCEERCKVMLRKWLRQNPSANWGVLIDAIDTLNVSITTKGLHIDK